ncbi:MAG: plastocyanin/azurin family copper-binding protein [Chloroflexota bacterium]
MRHAVRIIAAPMAIALLAGCSPSAAPATGTRNRSMTHPTIVANPTGNPDAFYKPNPIRIKVGQIVAWTNTDHDLHDVTARNGMFNSGPIASGATYRWEATRPGTYRYFCTIHPDMHGVIIVRK